MTKTTTTQEGATKPRPLDPKTGRELDEFNLPLSGPARMAELARLKKSDPREDPEAWGVKPATPAGASAEAE